MKPNPGWEPSLFGKSTSLRSAVLKHVECDVWPSPGDGFAWRVHGGKSTPSGTAATEEQAQLTAETALRIVLRAALLELEERY